MVPVPRATVERPEPADDGAGDMRLPTRGERPDRDEGDFIDATSFAPLERLEEPEVRPRVISEPDGERLRVETRGSELREVVAVGVADWETTGDEAVVGALRKTRPERPGLLAPMVPVLLRGPAPVPV